MAKFATPNFKNMAEKQLIVAVEGIAAMGSYQQAVVSDYLDKIIGSLPLAEIVKNLKNLTFSLIFLTFNLSIVWKKKKRKEIHQEGPSANCRTLKICEVLVRGAIDDNIILSESLFVTFFLLIKNQTFH